MAQLSKDQKQKIFLGGLMFIMGVAGIWMGLIKPMFTAIKGGTIQRENLRTSVKTAEREIATSTQVHAKAEELEALYNNVLKDIPDAAPITWFPPRVIKFFTSMGINGVTIARGGTSTPSQEALIGFEELGWTVTVPNTSFIKFGTALAAFETREPLVQVTRIGIVAGAPDAEFQTIEMTFNLLLPKQAEAGAP